MPLDAMTLIRLVCLVCAAAAAGCAGNAPDTILINGKVFTANPMQPWTQAIAIRGDRVVGTADTATIVAMAGPSTRTIDVGGRTIVPGFNDAHQHIAIAPPHETLSLPMDPTIEQIASELAAQIKSSPPGRLIQGSFGPAAWDNPSFTRTWLDRLAPQQPVALGAFTGHGMLLNSRALELIGIDESIVDPDGGKYGRDERGRLDGRLEEYADYVAVRRFAQKADAAEVVRLLREFAAEARAGGITSVQLMSNALPIAEMSKRLVEADVPIRWRVFRVPMREAGGDTIDSRPTMPPQPTPLIDTRGMKWFLDGTPVERLAFMRVPYADAPDTRGRMNLPQARLDEFVGWAYGSEDPLAVHAVGDAALDAYVSALERAGRPEVWRDKRPRIEHGDMLSPDLIARVKALGIVVVENPIHFSFTDVFPRRLDRERLGWMQPMKSLLAAGVPLAIGSDGPMNPGLNVMLATTHPANPKEALTREEAIVAYTLGSAFAEFKEKEKGRLVAGSLADLAVLSADIFTVPPPEMPKITSVLTIVGGRIVHETGAVH